MPPLFELGFCKNIRIWFIIKLKKPFRKTSIGWNALSVISSTLWNKVPEIKRTTIRNTFKHNRKKHYLKEI